MSRLTDDLNTLHDGFVEAINVAVAEDDLVRADRLAADYEKEAIMMIAVHEGRTDLLPISRPQHGATGVRALMRRITQRRAA
jgi:hypothetical protein